MDLFKVKKNLSAKKQMRLPEDPAFSNGEFSNSNSFVLDQLIAEAKEIFKTSTSPIFNPVWHKIIRRPNKKLFAFENEPTPGTKSGVFRYFVNSWIFVNWFIDKKNELENILIYEKKYLCVICLKSCWNKIVIYSKIKHNYIINTSKVF